MNLKITFVVGQFQNGCMLWMCTWYDFRGLDLYKALVGEGVPEELAHSWLQAEDGLAGGRLQEDIQKEKEKEKQKNWKKAQLKFFCPDSCPETCSWH